MKENNTTNNTKDTSKHTSENSAKIDLHKHYNKLNGFEAMLEITKKYYFVLIPFIVLSIAGSAYSFYNDYKVAFPMLSETVKIFVAIFISIMLEIVRDGSIIAIFNSKMKRGSRFLVIGIFVIVTFYMFNTHFKTIKVIEKNAIEYKLQHQTNKEIAVKNPKYDLVLNDINKIEKQIKELKAYKTPELIANSTSKFKAKREDAINRINNLDNKIDEKEKELKQANLELLSLKQGNIKNVTNSQQLVSSILLSTLVIVEALAMLGAVIKYIHTNNADKAFAKHKSVVKDYTDAVGLMKEINEELQSMLLSDMEQQNKNNIQIIKVIQANKKATAKQVAKLVGVVGESITDTEIVTPTKKLTYQNKEDMQEHIEPTRQIGFNVNTKDELINKLFEGKDKGDKLTPKTRLVDTKNRQQTKMYEKTMKDLQSVGAVKYKRGSGYYMDIHKEALEDTLRDIFY